MSDHDNFDCDSLFSLCICVCTHVHVGDKKTVEKEEMRLIKDDEGEEESNSTEKERMCVFVRAPFVILLK